MARPAGFEPATYGFEARRSIQLSYGRSLSMILYQGRSPLSMIFALRNYLTRPTFSRKRISFGEWDVYHENLCCKRTRNSEKMGPGGC
jgi:hypothetical protein